VQHNFKRHEALHNATHTSPTRSMVKCLVLAGGASSTGWMLAPINQHLGYP